MSVNLLFKGLRHSADPFLGLLRLLGALMTGSWRLLGVDFGCLGGILGPLGGVLGPLGGSWVTWGPSWVVMGPSRGSFWGPLGASWGNLGTLLDPCCGFLRASLDPLEAFWGFVRAP